MILFALVPWTTPLIAGDGSVVDQLIACCKKKGYPSVEECDQDPEASRACLEAASGAAIERAPAEGQAASAPAATGEDTSRLRTFGSPEMENILDQTDGLKNYYRVKSKKDEKVKRN